MPSQRKFRPQTIPQQTTPHFHCINIKVPFQMFNPFICGSFNQHHHHNHDAEEAADDDPWSPISSPRKSRRRSSRDSKNPYADRGLDKFSALLAELDDKRQRIYTQMGSEDISLVRFVYSNSNDCKPIVVKAKDRGKTLGHKPTTPRAISEPLGKHPIDSSSAIGAANLMGEGKQGDGIERSKKRRLNMAWSNITKLENWRQPSYYLPTIVILIMVMLAVFGRSFAIVCTSIGWYLVPTIKAKRPSKKKQYVRKLSMVNNKKVSNNRSSSPTSVLTAAMNDVSPRRHSLN